MAASETVRLRLQFDYPPPATPHCTSFWLLIDLNRCRFVTDLISLIRQRFGFSSGALLGLYLDGGLLPPAESARLVRDNDSLRCAGGRAGRGRGASGTRLRTPEAPQASGDRQGRGGGCRFGWLSKCTAPRTPEILIGLVWYGGLRSLHCNEHPSPGCCWFWRLLDQTWRNLDLGFGQSLRSSSFGLVDASFARHCVRRAGVPSPGG